jgi:hypothetical protein
MDNVLSSIPNKQQEQIKPELKALFYQRDRQAADLTKWLRLFARDQSCVLLFYAVIRSLRFHILTMPAPTTKQPDTEIVHNS